MNETAESGGGYTTSRLAAAAGYSVQQVRDLEQRGVIPPASRQSNGYRLFGPAHLRALRAYRQLAIAVDPVSARRIMREVRELPHDEAIASVVALHVDLARTRDQTIAALRALETIVEEERSAAPLSPGDAMSITELSAALGVRSSALRFWEHQGLVTPERTLRHGVRSYPAVAIRDARVVAALREGGYRIPAVHAVIASLHALEPDRARQALQGRLRAIAARSDALLRAGSALADVIAQKDNEPSSIQ